jgi:hypothetical protein
VKAAIYARYSSEDQRPESIEDQVNSCRKLARERGYLIDDQHIFSDRAASGARKDRRGLNAMLAASEAEQFGGVIVDDQPHPGEREVHQALGLEPHRNTPRSEDGTTAGLSKARERMGHHRG